LGALVGLGIGFGLQFVPAWRREGSDRRWRRFRAGAAALGTAMFYALVAVRRPEGGTQVQALVLGTAFIALLLIDIETRLLPDAITGPAALFALATSYWTVGPASSLVAGAIALGI